MSKQLIYDLNQLIEQKLELFYQMLDVTVSQKEDIENNQADNIESLVKEKQEIIDKIDQLDKRFLEGYQKLKAELKLDHPNKIDTAKYPELATFKKNVEEIMELAGKIMLLETSNNEKLTQLFNEVKKELRQINAGKRSIKAYEPAPVYNDGIYIDKKK